MKIMITKNYDEMCARAADFLFSQVILKPDCVLGLATGSTPCGIYADLARRKLDFSAVRSVNLDEYVGLDPANDQSYRYYMEQNLFSHVNIKRENTHLPNGRASDLALECEEYDRMIAALGGIDMQLLGIGLNGHIGFNEPNEAFDKGTHMVDLTKSTIEANARFFKSADEVPRRALTMGIQTIMSAKKILLVMNGANKKDAALAAIRGPITPGMPASVLQLHPDVVVILDEEAAQLL